MRDFLFFFAVVVAFAHGYFLGRTVTGLLPLLEKVVKWLEGDTKKKPPGGTGA